MSSYERKVYISIIVPVYNAERYLKKCIESLRIQKYDNLEIILVDDGSTDSSGIMCDRYSKVDSRIKTVHKKNGGVSSARNVGIEMALGDYLMFVDSDDWMEENAIECLSDNLNNMRDLDYIAASYYDDFADETKVLKKIVEEDMEVCSQELPSFLVSNYMLFTTPWAKVFKASIINDYRLRFDESVKYAEDMIFNMQYLKYAVHIKLISFPIYNYTLAVPGSAQTKYYPDMADYRIKTFETVMDVVSPDFEKTALKYFSIALGHYGYYIYEKSAKAGIIKLVNYFSEIIPLRMLVKEFGYIKAILVKKKLSSILYLIIFVKRKRRKS